MERQIVLHHRYALNILSMFADGKTIEQAKQEFDKLQAQYEKEVQDQGYELKLVTEWAYEDSDVFLEVWRPETDAEFSKREVRNKIARDKAAKKREEAKAKARAELYKKESDERAEYERLRAKFDPVDTLDGPMIKMFRD
jgi:hypothetical protein